MKVVVVVVRLGGSGRDLGGVEGGGGYDDGGEVDEGGDENGEVDDVVVDVGGGGRRRWGIGRSRVTPEL